MSQALKIIDKKRVFKKKLKHPKLKRFFWRFLLVTLLLFGGYVLFFSSCLKVKEIVVKGNQQIVGLLIKKQVQTQLAGEYFKGLKKDNLLLVNQQEIAKNLKNQFKLIREIKIKKKYFSQKLVILLQERIPSLVIVSKGQNYLVDENGQVYEKIDLANSKIQKNLIVLRDESNPSISLGEIIITRNYLAYLKGIQQKLNTEINLKLSRNFWTPTLISGDIRVKIQEGWEIYFNQNIKLEQEVEDLKIVLNKEINFQQRQDLKYIDLRINNKVYYCFQEGTPETIKQQKDATYSTALSGEITTQNKKKKD